MKTYTAAVVAAFALCACFGDRIAYVDASDPASATPNELRFYGLDGATTIRLVSEGVSAFERIDAPAWLEVSVPAGEFSEAEMDARLLSLDGCERIGVLQASTLYDCGEVSVEFVGGHVLSLPVRLER